MMSIISSDSLSRASLVFSILFIAVSFFGSSNTGSLFESLLMNLTSEPERNRQKVSFQEPLIPY